jgi:hypothetical protein
LKITCPQINRLECALFADGFSFSGNAWSPAQETGETTAKAVAMNPQIACD